MASPGVEREYRLGWPPRRTIPTASTRRDTAACSSSTDGARTWAKQDAPPGSGHITALLPLSRESLLIGTAAGLFRSTGGVLESHRTARRPPLRGTAAEFRRRRRGRRDGRGRVPKREWRGFLGRVRAAAGECRLVWPGARSRTAGGALAATSQGCSVPPTAAPPGVRCAAASIRQPSARCVPPERAGEALAAQFGTIFRTTDGGLSWRPLGDGGRNGAYPSALLILPGVAAAPVRVVSAARRSVYFHRTPTGQHFNNGGN